MLASTASSQEDNEFSTDRWMCAILIYRARVLQPNTYTSNLPGVPFIMKTRVFKYWVIYSIHFMPFSSRCLKKRLGVELPGSVIDHSITLGCSCLSCLETRSSTFLAVLGNIPSSILTTYRYLCFLHVFTNSEWYCIYTEQSWAGILPLWDLAGWLWKKNLLCWGRLFWPESWHRECVLFFSKHNCWGFVQN